MPLPFRAARSSKICFVTLGVIGMKKFVAMVAGAILIGACVLGLSDKFAAAAVKKTIGTYQCAICGIIARVPDNSTVLNERDLYGDGHVHDWRYIGGVKGGTLHRIR